MEVTLKELLDSRENRVWHQQELLEKYGGVLVSVTLNIPGPIKDRPQYREVMEWGMMKLLSVFGDRVCYHETRFLKTGIEGYICLVDINPHQVKNLAIGVENMEKRGRLLDIDVLTNEGGVSRSEMGMPPRKCLLCDEDAKACARSQKHSIKELLVKVDELCYDE